MANQSTKINKSLSFVPTTAPTNPVLDEIYLDSTSNSLLQWSGSAWLPFGSAALNYAQAQHDGGYQWNTTSLTFAAPSNVTAGTFSVLKSNGITLTAASSNGTGITFTPSSSTSVYLISSTVHLFNNTNNAGTAIRLTDGTTVIATTGGNGNGSAIDAVTIVGIYVPGSATSTTVQLQFAVLGGGGTAQTTIGNIFGGSAPIEVGITWTVLQIGQ